MNIFLLSPNESEYLDIEEAIKATLKQLNHNVITWIDSGVDFTQDFEFSIDNAFDKVDLIVAHTGNNDPDTALEIGFALGKKKPVLIVCEKKDLDQVRPDVFSSISIIFERNRIQETLAKPLIEHLGKDNIEKYLQKEKAEVKRKKEIKTVFVSYSHEDILFLERLSIHIKPFEKNGLLDFWSDTKIKAGEKWKDKIENALDKAAIAILLISADFLASDFIVENELPPLLKAAEEKGTIILPIILKPCRFVKNTNLSIFQSINDPKLPLSKMDETQREETYVKICDYLDNLIS